MLLHDLERFLNAPPFKRNSCKKSEKLHTKDINKRYDRFINIVNSIVLKDATSKRLRKIQKHDRLLVKILHDADCLDIMRIYRGESFERRRLYFYNDLKKSKKNLGIDLDELIDEIERFIISTEVEGLKLNLEQDRSQEHFKAVLEMLHAKLPEGTSCFPIISSLIA